jgi:hypothetical protein
MKTVIGLVLAIAIALGIYAFTSGKFNVDKTETAPETTTTNQDKLQGNGSLNSILGLNQNITCTFERTDENGSFNGTAYVADNKFRGDFVMNLDDIGLVNSQLINRDGITYVWAGNQGSKFTDAATNPDAEPKPDTNAVNLEDEVQYSCTPWKKDLSKFEIPQDVTFTDISEMMENLPVTTLDNTPTSTTPTPNIDCSVCNQVPAGSAQDQCKAALGC